MLYRKCSGLKKSTALFCWRGEEVAPINSQNSITMVEVSRQRWAPTQHSNCGRRFPPGGQLKQADLWTLFVMQCCYPRSRLHQNRTRSTWPSLLAVKKHNITLLACIRLWQIIWELISDCSCSGIRVVVIEHGKWRMLPHAAIYCLRRALYLDLNCWYQCDNCTVSCKSSWRPTVWNSPKNLCPLMELPRLELTWAVTCGVHPDVEVCCITDHPGGLEIADEDYIV